MKKEEIKVCIKCKVEKPFSDFYWRPEHNSPRSSCKKCFVRDSYVYLIKSEKKYPDKKKAREQLRRQVRIGEVKKLACEKCGEKKTQAHHPDYSKPLEVLWLCIKHHKEIHKQICLN